MTISTDDLARLADLLEGRASAAERASLESRIRLEPALAEAWQELRELSGRVRREALVEDAPEAAIARALALFEPRRAPVRDERPGPLRRVLASLRFDSAAQAASGVRGAAEPASSFVTRQLLLSAGDREVDLRISREQGAWSLAGQVLGPGQGGHARLVSTGVDAGVVLDEDDSFVFRRLPAGAYALVIDQGEVQLAVPEFEIGLEAGKGGP